MLRVSRVPPGDPTLEDSVGQNRFECLTCPYHFIINKRYYERKYMKKKEVEDILGGKGAWDNVDKTPGMFVLGFGFWVWIRGGCVFFWRERERERAGETTKLTDSNSAMSKRKMQKRRGVLVSAADSQC